MKMRCAWLLAVAACVPVLTASCQEKAATSVPVPILLDHNRVLVDAEIQSTDGGWRKARLWIGAGNPNPGIGTQCRAAHDRDRRDARSLNRTGERV